MKMKMKSILVAIGAVIILSGCSKTDSSSSIKTSDVKSLTDSTAISGGLISTDDVSSITSCGVCWSTNSNPTISDNKTMDGMGKYSYLSTLTGLTPFTTYYLRAYLTNSDGTIYGNEVNFTTTGKMPKASFECVSNKGFKVSFSNSSENPTNLLWDFGDGSTSTELTPTHVYNLVGTYNVKLVVSNDGKTDSITKPVVISDEVSLNNLKVPDGSNFFTDVDVDMDGENDISFRKLPYLNSTSSGYSLDIHTSNYCGIISDSLLAAVTTVHTYDDKITNIEKFIVPKILVLGDKIKKNDPLKFGYLYINVHLYSYYNGQCVDFDSLNKDEIRYIGFRKIVGNQTKIGWIKLKVFEGVITLLSYKIPKETDSLIINN